MAVMDSALMSSSVSHKPLGCLDSSLTRYLPLFHVTIYVCVHVAHFNTARFSMSPSAGAALLASFNPKRRNKVAVAWQKWWKNSGRRGSSNLRVACRCMDSLSVSWREQVSETNCEFSRSDAPLPGNAKSCGYFFLVLRIIWEFFTL